jgi:hypothetical protein
MLLTFQNVLDTAVDGKDGNIGSLQDLLFERKSWHIRYLVVDTGNLFGKRQVLLVPGILTRVDWSGTGLTMPVTRQQANEALDIDECRPLSRRKEHELARHFGWQPYWQTGPAGLPSNVGLPTTTVSERIEPEDALHVGSARSLIGFDVKSREADVGYAGSLVFDDQEWMTRYLVVDVGSLLSDRRVLVASDWLTIDWDAQDIRVDVTCDEMEGAPEFDLQMPIHRDYETLLYDHYGRQRYWE